MDSQGRLLLRFNDDGDGTGKLFAQANSSGFSGEGSAWFSNKELQDFADTIAAFPILEGKSPEITGGFFKKDGSGELEQENLALKVYPIDRRGHLGIQVRIATELWNEERLESQHLVRLEIVTSYEPLMQFSRKLKALAEGRVEEVVLYSDISPQIIIE
jgi:hypothetical protein